MTHKENPPCTSAYLCLQQRADVQNPVSESDLRNLSGVLSAFEDGHLLGHLVRSGRWAWLDQGQLVRVEGAK